MLAGFFVAGTDTGVGKTTLSCELLHYYHQRGYTTQGMKPVASGAVLENSVWVHGDVEKLKQASHISGVKDGDICPYLLQAPIAPSLAAQREGIVISLDIIESSFKRLAALADICIVEAAGGVLVPLDQQGNTMLSIAQKLSLPVILVVGIRLGSINHALLSQQAISQAGLTLAGWIANRLEEDTQQDQEAVIGFLKTKIQAPMLADYPFCAGSQAATGAWPEVFYNKKDNTTTCQSRQVWTLPDSLIPVKP